ncbi:hypothetical protein JL100_017920 [Skermanella mucosa]|uniref:hypothetical protein n=1 Tax=Skermanella mucosa TaxID=1789672 RepID=UPI00192A991C|nr:hypothetical protein [Skermanella mucosa]UEM18963.1 hypothetical protein JL100_017920 [Skermanella mucosa]
MTVTVFRFAPAPSAAVLVHLTPIRLLRTEIEGYHTLPISATASSVPLHEKCEWIAQHATGKWYVDLFRTAPVSPGWNCFLFEHLNDAILTRLRWA